ncbi:hypothetical protein EB1_06680 [Empedobacter brevis NBRC 14943 = ATCC 43319]|uniref:Uncharacterized protein n=1 Tax=Empedobacter brevis NBRC 14943 = ATCC 43319 TaxID=1218108 RepID=A0A511NED6_9FLAO|nr:hypothetical protein EB1_06680 [Empedobacter brevis NBRC 14943 = ATCC 43319]
MITNPVDILLNNLYFVNSEFCTLFQAVNNPAIQLKKTTNIDVLNVNIFSKRAYPKKKKIVTRLLINNSVVNKFRIAFDDFEITKIFSKRNVVKIERIATKLKKALYVPDASGPYILANINPPTSIIT